MLLQNPSLDFEKPSFPFSWIEFYSLLSPLLEEREAKGYAVLTVSAESEEEGSERREQMTQTS